MDPAVLLKIVELGIAEIVPVEQLVIKLKNYFTLNPNVKISIQSLASEAIQADDDDLIAIAAWQTAHGFPVTVKPPAPAPVVQMPSPAPQSSTPSGSAPSASSSAAPTEAAHDGAAVGSASDAAAAAPTPAPAAAGNPGVTGDHGEIGDIGTNKPSAST